MVEHSTEQVSIELLIFKHTGELAIKGYLLNNKIPNAFARFSKHRAESL